jgi:CHAT domain-containing protein
VYGHILCWKGAVFIRQFISRAARIEPELKPLFQELELVSLRLSNLAFSVPDPKQRESWQRQTAELSDRKETLERDLATKSAAFRQQQALLQLTSDDVRKALPQKAALIDVLEYSQFSPPAGGKGELSGERRLVAFVVRHDQPIVQVDMGPAAPIVETMAFWLDRINKGSATDSGRDRSAVELRALVWQKLEPHLGGIDTVLVSPDGELGRLPFGALPGKKAGTYLIEDLNIVVVPVPRLLTLVHRPDSAKPLQNRAVIVGDVAFDADPTSNTKGSPVPTLMAEATHRSALRFGDESFGPLLGTKQEINEIAALHAERFGASQHKTIRGAAATENALRTEAPNCAYLHLATHGFFRPSDQRQEGVQPNRMSWSFENQEQVVGVHPGLQCGLALAGANRKQVAGRPEQPAQDDGILTAIEVASVDLRDVELVTLSACETGLGKTAGGEGVLGLQRAFQIAGAKNVVASLWKVNDQATAALMRLFYHKLWAEKKSPAVALREAQLWILNNPDQIQTLTVARGPNFGKVVQLADSGKKAEGHKRSSPYLWAGFVIAGSGN